MQAVAKDGSVVGIVQVMGAAALWATVGVASRLVPSAELLSDSAMGMARMALGGPLILALAVVMRPDRLAGLLQLDLGRLLIFAAGCAVFQVCLFKAFTLLGVTETVFLTVCLPPLLACGMSALRRDAALTRPAILALALAVAGLCSFAAGSGPETTGDGRWTGLGLAVLASVAFVAMTEAARCLTQAVGPLVVVGAGLTLAGLLMLIGLAVVAPQSVAAPAHESWRLLALILYLGVGPTALAYVIYCSGMARCRSSSVGLIASMIEPGLAALLAWAVLSERLGPIEMLGCAMVTGAMVVLWWSQRPARA